MFKKIFSNFKRLTQSVLRLFGLQLIPSDYLLKINESHTSQTQFDLNFFKEVAISQFDEALLALPNSQAQLRQDLLVLCHTNFKENGYFVEFSSCDGRELSNTYLLEKDFKWNGILAEPGRIWHKDLYNHRNCHISEDCVWRESDQDIVFNEVGELSTIEELSNQDLHAQSREVHTKYLVKTISLNDLLSFYNAPSHIDYLSIDTEGSEFEILSNLNFQKYTFSIITVEHNFSKNQKKIFDLLIANGYEQIFMGLSSFDDWYVKTS